MDVGKEIRRLREERGWSQAKLAAGADMGVSGISQIETGARNPSAVTLSKIAEALGVGVSDLFPKESAPPSLQPSFSDALEEERREAVYGPWLDFVDRYVSHWEERIDAGDLSPGSVDEFLDVLDALTPVLQELNAGEQRGLPKQPSSFGAPAAKTGVALHRLLDLLNPMLAAGASKFKNSELEQLRNRRATQEAALENVVRKGA